MPTGEHHVPTNESRLLVKELYAAGVTKERIAMRFGICDDTLNKHYIDELDNSLEGMISGLGKTVYQRALEGNDKMAEFWLKCRGRWSYAKAAEDTAKSEAAGALMEKLIDKL